MNFFTLSACRGKGGLADVSQVAFPLVIASIGHGVNLFVDRVMLANYSEAAVAAAFPAGLTSFTISCIVLGVVGYAGVFGTDKRWKVLCGSCLAVVIRIIAHVLSGVVFYSQNAWDGWGAWGYSLAFNLSSRLPEGILSVIIVMLLPLHLLRGAIRPKGEMV